MIKFLLVLASLTLPILGCAHSEGIREAPLHFGKPLNLTTYPELAVGIRVTPAIESGQVTIIDAPISDSQIGGEMRAGRISFPGWSVNSKGGEAFAQFVLVGNYRSGEFKSFVIIDGKFSDFRSAKFIPLSSRGDCTWSSGQLVPIDRIRFNDEKKYRAEVVEKYGVRVGSRHLVKGFYSQVKSWNRYMTDYGEVYSPLGEDDMKRIAKINPGYTGFQRFVLRNRMVISLNPIEMVAKASITLWETAKSPPKGWDFYSEISGAEASAMFEIVSKLRQSLISELNEELAKKEAEIEALKKEEIEKPVPAVPAKVVEAKKPTTARRAVVAKKKETRQ